METITNPEIKLRSDRGLIFARVTNRSDFDVRVVDVCMISRDATGQESRETRKYEFKREFKRWNGMHYVMPPHSSFEVIFSASEASYTAYLQEHSEHSPIEFFVEVKLEDGAVISSHHRQVVVTGQSKRLRLRNEIR